MTAAGTLDDSPADDQREVIAFLASVDTHAGAEVRRIDTHSAIVFLAGQRAFKLKRAVRYDYLDFSTIELRRRACEAEFELNHRAAPGIYRGVLPVVRRADGSLAIGESGAPVDWLLEMNRFDEELLFDRLAARKALDLDVMRPLASAIVRFHASAPVRPDQGGVAGMRWVVDGNADGFARYGTSVLDSQIGEQVTEEARRELERHAPLLEARRTSGRVRQCHGDLHLRNIVMFEGRPTLFDAVEFNDAIACGDVVYDVAFLLMDLWRRRLAGHANGVWNSYLAETGDYASVSLLPLFLSCRAAVRAKTSATAASLQPAAGAKAELERAAREYLDMALRFLHPAPPLMMAIGGFSGSGKSTLALALAPEIGAPPGAVVLRSDELRKRLCGVPPLERLGPEGYAPDVSARVYALLATEAGAIVTAGGSVIVDAVCAHPDERSGIERAAFTAGVPFCGVWLDADERILAGRLGRRVGDVSDADVEVLSRQYAKGSGPVTWHRLDASLSPDALRSHVLERCESAGAQLE